MHGHEQYEPGVNIFRKRQSSLSGNEVLKNPGPCTQVLPKSMASRTCGDQSATLCGAFHSNINTLVESLIRH